MVELNIYFIDEGLRCELLDLAVGLDDLQQVLLDQIWCVLDYLVVGDYFQLHLEVVI